jgi:hypothetical protein
MPTKTIDRLPNAAGMAWSADVIADEGRIVELADIGRQLLTTGIRPPS